jgi:hypothetical protein
MERSYSVWSVGVEGQTAGTAVVRVLDEFKIRPY